MARRAQHRRSEPKSTIPLRTRVRNGALVGVPLGLAMGTYAALAVSDHQSLVLWGTYLAGSVFAFATLGAFVGATSIPRRGDD